MPLHRPTVLTPRLPRLTGVATVAAACATVAAATVVSADAQPASPVLRIADHAGTRYFDIEANKAISMRALSRHIAEQSADRPTPYQDLEANKARSQRAR